MAENDLSMFGISVMGFHCGFRNLVISVIAADKKLSLGSVDVYCLMPQSKVLIPCHRTDREGSVLAFHFSIFLHFIPSAENKIMIYLKNEN